MEIGGLTRFTTQDYPGLLACTIFVQGCNMNCGYCHNQGLIPQVQGSIPWNTVHDFLIHRIGILDAVVFSGGEPTLFAEVPEYMHKVKRMGFAIGLHTNGTGKYYLPAAVLSDFIMLSHPKKYSIRIARQNADKVALSRVHKEGDEWVNNLTWIK